MIGDVPVLVVASASLLLFMGPAAVAIRRALTEDAGQEAYTHLLAVVDGCKPSTTCLLPNPGLFARGRC
jgi:hypothetical protein